MNLPNPYESPRTQTRPPAPAEQPDRKPRSRLIWFLVKWAN
jgi:hypothetical protein